MPPEFVDVNLAYIGVACTEGDLVTDVFRFKYFNHGIS